MLFGGCGPIVGAREMRRGGGYDMYVEDDACRRNACAHLLKIDKRVLKRAASIINVKEGHRFRVVGPARACVATAVDGGMACHKTIEINLIRLSIMPAWRVPRRPKLSMAATIGRPSSFVASSSPRPVSEATRPAQCSRNQGLK